MKAKKLIINGEEHELVSSVNGQTGDIIIDKSNTKTFFLASDQDLATAQEVLDRMKNGNHPIIIYDDEVYIYDGVGQTKSREKVTFKSTKVSEYTDTATGYTDMISKKIELDYDGDTRQIYSIGMDIQTQSPHTLDTDIDYPYPYDPVYPGSPTTKRYVDKHDTMVSATAPSNPTEGMVWYDTTNDVLKVYNGTTWDTIATGGAISDTAYGSGWDGQTTIAPSQNAVYDKISTMDTAISSNTTNINTINNKIPSEATSSNKLADKQYVLDNINSVTAYYITKNANGDQFATHAELAAATTFYSGGVVRVPTKNDYTIVLDDENHDHATTRYIYNNGWEYQYTINETPLTQTQLNALNSGITAAKVTKYDTLNTREFTLSGVGNSATVLTEAQEVFDWINAGNFAILKIATDSGQPTYLYKATTVDDVRFLSSDMVDGGYSDNFTTAMQKGVEIHYSGTTVTGVSYINNLTWQFLAINGQYQSAFMPTQDAHPATKKYVDSKSTIVSATAPSSPTEGMLWYDTTNDVLKTYNGTNWIEVGVESNTKTFYLSSTSDLTTAQAAYDWWNAGKYAIIVYQSESYVYEYDSSTQLKFKKIRVTTRQDSSSVTQFKQDFLYFTLSSGTVTQISAGSYASITKVLSTDVNYSTPYTPLYDGSPATKKYVDDSVVEYNAGEGIEIGNASDYSAMQGPAPTGYHVPLNTEWQAVYDIWTALGGGSSDGTNFGIALKLPFAGYRFSSSAGVGSQGSYGFYWSSSRNNTNNAYLLNFNSSDVLPQNANYRAFGYSVRCFKNSPTVPTSSWTKLYGTSIEAGGIFWGSTEGLISMSSDGQTWITIQDKNLGATTVWNSGDTLSEANCGKYYQRGNNYGFPRTGSVTTSSTQADASTYGPWNYYSSSTFITRNSSPYRWDTTDNGNLRGGVTGVVTYDNAIINTGVLSVNGQTGDVTIDDNTKIFVVNEPALTSGGSISNVEPFKDICERLISNPKHIAYITNKRSIMPHELNNIGSVMQIISHSGQFLDENNWMFNFIYIGFPFAENKELFKYCGTIEIGDGTARVANITANKINFTPSNSGTAGQVLTKTSSNYEWKDASGGFELAPNSPLSPKYRRYGTQAQYEALTQYYTDEAGDTVYFTI